MRLAAYAGTSTVLAAGVILRAFHQRANFYSACVYLSQSNACLMILANFLLFLVCGAVYGLSRALYGRLRPLEVEALYDKAWFAVTETCLAMTIFRDEAGPWFVFMFVCLLVGKIWGWVGEGRVDFLEQQQPTNPRMFHARLSISLFLSIAYDLYLLNYATMTVWQQARPDMMVMFAFEFALLTLNSMSSAAKYILCLAEARINQIRRNEILEDRRQELRTEQERTAREQGATSTTDAPPAEDPEDMDIEIPPWHDKPNWVFAMNLVTDFSRLVLYLVFFVVLYTFYGLPIHIMREVFLALKSFINRLTAFARYRQATKDMNRLFPDATGDEIGADDVCIVCRDDMTAWQENPANSTQAPTTAEGQPPRRRRPVDETSRPKKLPCGHILHFGCLRNWLERQQTCPTCRQPVLSSASRNTRTQPLGQQVPAQAAAADENQPPPPPAPPQPGAVAQPNAPQLRPAANNGFRFMNFGPLRIGFGAGIIQNPRNVQGNPDDNAGQRGFSFGIGGGRPEINANNPRASTTIPREIASLEMRVLREIEQLHLERDQLRVVRAMQEELSRLRGVQAQVAAGQTVAPPQLIGTHVTTTLPHAQSHPPQPVQAFQAPEGNHVMVAGDPRLPSGVVLPDGYTLMPLQPMDGQVNGPGRGGPSNVRNVFSSSSHSWHNGVPHAMPPNPDWRANLRDGLGPRSLPRQQNGGPLMHANHDTGPINNSALGGSINQAHRSTNVPMRAQTYAENAGPREHLGNGTPTASSTLQRDAVELAAVDVESPPSIAPGRPASTTDNGVDSEGLSLNGSNIPDWSSTAPDLGGNATDGAESTSTHGKSINASTASDSQRKEEKGKGRAVTVEDLVEDID